MNEMSLNGETVWEFLTVVLHTLITTLTNSVELEEKRAGPMPRLRLNSKPSLQDPLIVNSKDDWQAIY